MSASDASKSDRENLTKPWYRTGWGMVVAFLFLPFFALWYIWAKTAWSRNAKISVTAAIAVLFIITAASSEPQSQPSSSKAPQKAPVAAATSSPKPKTDTSSLDATIRTSALAFKIENNETTSWVGCKLKLNDKFEYKGANIPAKDSVIIAFSSFTKSDGTRFDYSTTAIKNLYLSCESTGIRYGYYTLGAN